MSSIVPAGDQFTCQCLAKRRTTLKIIGLVDIIQYLCWFSFGIYLVYVPHTPIIKAPVLFIKLVNSTTPVTTSTTTTIRSVDPDPTTETTNSSNINSTIPVTEHEIKLIDKDTPIESILIGFGSTGVAGGICLIIGVYTRSKKLCRMCQLSICTRFFSAMALCILFGMEGEWMLFVLILLANILYFWTWAVLHHFLKELKSDFKNDQLEKGFASYTEIQQAFDIDVHKSVTTLPPKANKKRKKTNSANSMERSNSLQHKQTESTI